jgi:multiple sugar transport system substrate-binding protein
MNIGYKFLRVFGLIVLMIAVAACSPAVSEPAADEGVGPEVTEGESAAPAEVGEVVQVKMVLWPGPEGDAMQQVVDTYNAGQGVEDGIEVEMILLSRDDTFAREATEIGAQSSNVDIYFTASYNVGFFATGLDPIDDLELDESLYFPAAINGLKINGEQYALPLDVSNHFLYYRTDLIDELLSNADWQATYRTISEKVIGEARDPKHPDEWDTDDYLAAAAFFSQVENPDSPTQYGTALQAKTSPFNITLWNDLLWGVGGSWLDEAGNANLTTPEAQRAMELYRTIYTSGYTSPDSAQWEYPETNGALQSGNVAFAIQWSAAFAELSDPERSPEIADTIAVAPMPGDPHSTHVHALAISLNKFAPNKEAAKTWMKYLATPEAMDQYAKAGGIPSMPEVLSNNVDVNPVFGEIAAHVQEYGYSFPIFAGTFDAMTALTEELSPAWVGITPVDEALETAQSRLQGLLERD